MIIEDKVKASEFCSDAFYIRSAPSKNYDVAETQTALNVISEFNRSIFVPCLRCSRKAIRFL